MIQTLSIRNFQSIAHLDVELAPLTVFVGPSSSGKSALIRALDTLIRNRRGTSFITHGERVASVTARIASTDPMRNGTVTLTRSTQQAPNSYVILPDDPAHPHHPKAEFTKLNGETPEAVSTFLGIPAGQAELVIASQFDKPYLMDASGSEVARVLGSLTNANVLLNGARESNRQRTQNAQTLRTRAADLEAITARVPEFRALASQRTALERAESMLEEARSLQRQVTSLTSHLDTIAIAERRIPALRANVASIPEPADLDALIQSYVDARKRLTRYTESIQTVSTAQRGVQRAQADLAVAEQAHHEAVVQAQTAMGGIVEGFARYFREHMTPLEDVHSMDVIHIDDAARLATRYVATLEG